MSVLGRFLTAPSQIRTPATRLYKDVDVQGQGEHMFDPIQPKAIRVGKQYGNQRVQIIFSTTSFTRVLLESSPF